MAENMLPWEVKDKIFIFLDCVSQTKCRAVCRSWKEFIDDIQEKQAFWKKSVEKDVPEPVKRDLLDNICPSHWAKDSVSSDVWKIIYQTWYKWGNNVLGKQILVPDKMLTMKRLNMFRNDISAIKTSGHWLIISTSIGTNKIIGLNWNTLETVTLFHTTDMIKRFELVYCEIQPSETEAIAGPSGGNRDDILRWQVFDLMEHNEIWIELQATYVILERDGIIVIDRNNGRTIRHSEGFQAELVNEEEFDLLPTLQLNVFKRSNPIETRWSESLNETFGTIIDLSAKIVTVGAKMEWGDGQYTSIFMMKFGGENNNDSYVDVTMKRGHYDNPKFWCWRAEFFITSSSMGRLGLQVWDNEKTYNYDHTTEHVTAALFYSNHLFLGTNLSRLLIFGVEKVEDCLRIDLFETQPKWSVLLGTSKFTHIVVVENYNINGNPMIVLTTPDELIFLVFEKMDEVLK